MRKVEKDTYSVADLRLAAFLKLRDFKLRRIDNGSDGKCVFVFEDHPDRPGLIVNFLNRQELVEPISFIEEQRNLKGVCRQSQANR